MTNCTVSGNSGISNTEGGGVYVEGVATITGSTFSNNTGGNGGALHVRGSPSRVTNSTFSGNSSLGTITIAGAAYFGDTATVTNSTFVGNQADGPKDAAMSAGIVFENTTGSGTLTLTSSILVNNLLTGQGNKISDCEADSGVIGRNNLMTASEGPMSCELKDKVDDNIVGEPDPKVAALADNGCVAKAGGGNCVRTHALLSGSPAIDKGTAGAGLATDQRGYRSRVTGAAADIGALESDAKPDVTATAALAAAPACPAVAVACGAGGGGNGGAGGGDGTAPTSIPTLGPWGLVLAGGLLGAIGWRYRRRT